MQMNTDVTNTSEKALQKNGKLGGSYPSVWDELKVFEKSN